MIGIAGLPLVAAAEEWPARVLDLSRWKLTLPVEGARAGRPAEIKQPELDSFADPRIGRDR
jgi:poly(beta-D-mannuronate) lyase